MVNRIKVRKKMGQNKKCCSNLFLGLEQLISLPEGTWGQRAS